MVFVLMFWETAPCCVALIFSLYQRTWRSQNSSVSIVSRLLAGWPGFDPLQGLGSFPLSALPDWLWGLPNLLSNGYQGLFSQGLGCEVDLSPPSGAEVRTVWNYTSILPYFFMALFLVKHRVLGAVQGQLFPLLPLSENLAISIFRMKWPEADLVHIFIVPDHGAMQISFLLVGLKVRCQWLWMFVDIYIMTLSLVVWSIIHLLEERTHYFMTYWCYIDSEPP